MYYTNFNGNYIIDMTIKKDGKIENVKKKIPLTAGIEVVKKVVKEMDMLIDANKVSYAYFRDCLNKSKLKNNWMSDKYDMPCALISIDVYCYKDNIKYDLNKTVK